MIKFRAYCKNCKKYTYFNDSEHHYHNYYGKLIAFCSNGDNDFGDFEYRLNNLEQFTGLKDKNGVDIYVGDIVVLNNTKTLVNYHMEVASFALEHDLGSYQLTTNKIERLKVIGNINENKEMLENE